MTELRRRLLEAKGHEVASAIAEALPETYRSIFLLSEGDVLAFFATTKTDRPAAIRMLREALQKLETLEKGN